MKFNLLAATVVAAGLCASAANAAIVYNIDRKIGNGSVTGTITTDGTLGRLSLFPCDAPWCAPGGSNFLDWDLTLDDGHGAYKLTRVSRLVTDEHPAANVTNFWATPNSLLYDFTAEGYAAFIFSDNRSAQGPTWYLGGSAIETRPGNEHVYSGPDAYDHSHTHGFDHTWQQRRQLEYRYSEVVIGSAVSSVPEPGSLGLMAMGLIGIVGSRKLKRS